MCSSPTTRAVRRWPSCAGIRRQPERAWSGRLPRRCASPPIPLARCVSGQVRAGAEQGPRGGAPPRAERRPESTRLRRLCKSGPARSAVAAGVLPALRSDTRRRPICEAAIALREPTSCAIMRLNPHSTSLVLAAAAAAAILALLVVSGLSSGTEAADPVGGARHPDGDAKRRPCRREPCDTGTRPDGRVRNASAHEQRHTGARSHGVDRRAPGRRGASRRVRARPVPALDR